MSHFSVSRISLPSGSKSRLTLAEPTTQLRWPCAPLGGEIECSSKALHGVCMEAAAGLRKLSKGGLEIGGVLFGERANGLIRVLATRPIECEHRFGPSFVLSDTDEASLRGMLTGFRSDSALAALEPVGCYFTHSRHGSALTERDIELCNRYFGEKDQIVLLLIPNLRGRVEGTVLVRDAAGALGSCHEFEHSVLGSPQREAARIPPPSPSDPKAMSRVRTAAKLRCEVVPGNTPLHTPAATATEAPAKSEASHPAEPVSMGRPPGDQSSPLKMRSSLLASLLILLVCWPNRTIPVTQIPLSFTDSGSELIIHWDAARETVRAAGLGIMD